MMITCEDLLWEAVRRNKYYQADFIRLGNSSNRLDFTTGGFRYKWGITNPTDPDFSIHDFQKALAKNRITEDKHPYYRFFSRSDKTVYEIDSPPLTYQELRGANRDNSPDETEKKLLEWAKKAIVQSYGKVLVAFDPFETESEISKQVKVIRRKNKEKFKNRSTELVEDVNHTRKLFSKDSNDYEFYGVKINKGDLLDYLDWLELYDDILERAQESEKNGGGSCVFIEHGATVISKDFNFLEIIRDDEIQLQKKSTKGYDKTNRTDGDVTHRAQEALVKAFERAATQSANIIRSAPHRIYFLPSK